LEPSPAGCPFQYQDKRHAPCADCGARKPFQPPTEAMRRAIQKRQGSGGQVRLRDPETLRKILEESDAGRSRKSLSQEYGVCTATILKIAMRRGPYAEMVY
jgi:hypothetical protein